MSSDSESVPKLPRGRGIKLSGPELFRIALTLLTLIGVIVLTRPCANAVSGFVTSFDEGSDQGVAKPGTVDLPATEHYETLRPGMSEEEIKAAVERSRARAAGAATDESGNAASPAAPATNADGSASAPSDGSDAAAP